jgi:hypothetical protein
LNGRIREEQTTVFRSKAAGRRYLTRRAAVKAEARAMLRQRYPDQRAEIDEFGRITFGGWTWRDLPNADEIFRRLCRLIERGIE